MLFLRERDRADGIGEVQAKTWWHRGRSELALLLAIGLFMGAIGPFGTDSVPPTRRFAYWLICMIGGGLIGVLTDQLLGRRSRRATLRTIMVSLVMTPPVALLVMVAGHSLIVQRLGVGPYLALLWQVFVVSLAAMTIRAFVRRQGVPVVETRTIVEPPLPEAEAAFRRRLSATRRNARLIAVEAHDHYLRVHTDAGVELVTMRFADAVAELAHAHGYQVHRSWWVAAEAIEGVKWRRGGGDARLAGNVVAPVSRSHTADLRSAGWF